MSPDSWQEWVAWGGVVIPLSVLAFTAAFHVRNEIRKTMHKEYERFFEVMEHLGVHGGSIASKMAAAYEMRKFPQYSEVVIRTCENVQVDGDAAGMLREELRLTAEFLRKPD
jgi:2-phospho-L-lactate transferase/gluconeogenesis factor (CofD/UPF0052 family)